MVIDDDDKIMYIDAVSDNSHLRAMTFHLASGKEETYGSFNIWEETRHPKKRYDFSDKADLLGAFGRVAIDPRDQTSEHLVTLGFIMNNCPGRSLLDHEADWIANNTILDDLEYTVKMEAGDETIAMTIMFVIICASLMVCGYVCLKNRGKICKRGGNVDGPAVPPELPGDDG